MPARKVDDIAVYSLYRCLDDERMLVELFRQLGQRVHTANCQNTHTAQKGDQDTESSRVLLGLPHGGDNGVRTEREREGVTSSLHIVCRRNAYVRGKNTQAQSSRLESLGNHGLTGMTGSRYGFDATILDFGTAAAYEDITTIPIASR